MISEGVFVMISEVDKYCFRFGESNRMIIEAALKFLDENEPQWKLRGLVPMDRDAFIRFILYRIQVNPYEF